MEASLTREDVVFDSAGERCAAWLYRPAGSGQLPCVVMAHGWCGVREAGLEAYAEHFAAAGLAVLLFDYRNFGASTGEPRQLIGVRRQLDDWRRATAYARGLDGIDADRMAVWGTSFSGAHAITLAAEDDRIAAAVSQCPATDMRYALMRVPPRNAIRMTGAAIADLVGSKLGRPARYMPAVAPPGEFAAMTAAEADPGYHAIVPEGSTWRNEFAPRVALGVGFYRAVTKAKDVGCPLFVAVCDRDETTFPKPAEKAAALAPRGEAKHYDCGHFDIYLGDFFEATLADQSEFLTRHLLGA